jgi:hypothetical protein
MPPHFVLARANNSLRERSLFAGRADKEARPPACRLLLVNEVT